MQVGKLRAALAETSERAQAPRDAGALFERIVPNPACGVVSAAGVREGETLSRAAVSRVAVSRTPLSTLAPTQQRLRQTPA